MRILMTSDPFLLMVVTSSFLYIETSITYAYSECGSSNLKEAKSKHCSDSFESFLSNQWL